MGTSAAKLILLAVGIGAVGSLQATPFQLLKDVYPGPNSGARDLIATNSRILFWGTQPSDFGNPWTSDGTASGTMIVAPTQHSGGSFSGYAAAAGNFAYFVADDGINGLQLWRTDGSAVGTFAVTTYAGGYDSVYAVLPLGDHVLFSVQKYADSFTALMGTDGSVAGTAVLSTSVDVIGSGVVLASKGNTLVGPALFAGYGGASHTDLGFILSDGTPAGTGFFATPALSAIGQLAQVNDVVFFAGTDAANGNELWKTDGTLAGTALVKDIFIGTKSSDPAALTRVDDRVFFTAASPNEGGELWVSDGTDAGTQLVKDVHAGVPGSDIEALTALDGVLYFLANDGTHGTELWRSDATADGTTLALGDFNPGFGIGAFDYTYDTVTVLNKKLALVMNAGDSMSAAVPYASDGTLAGTHPIDATQSILVDYSVLFAANGRLFAPGEILPSSSGTELLGTDAFATLGNTWCSSPEQPIPDDSTDVGSSFHLPSYGGITALRVSVDIGHTYVGDLQVSLRHAQTGTRVNLINTPLSSPTAMYSCSGALLDITFDDSATADAEYSCTEAARPAYPRRASYRPVEPLSAFNGEAVEGDWQLIVSDVAAGDAGVLHEWCMSFSTDRIFGEAFD